MDEAHETVRLGRDFRVFEKKADSQRGSWELPNVHLPANKPPTAHGAVKSESEGHPGAGRLQMTSCPTLKGHLIPVNRVSSSTWPR